MKLMFITGNQEKLAIARSALGDQDIEIIGRKIKCPEIQHDDSEVIARHSAKYASDFTQSAVVKTDSGLYIPALGGFPGAYSEYVERKLDAQDIIKLMQGKDDRSAYYKEIMAFCEYLKDPITFAAYTHGKISEMLDGEQGCNFDRIFICDGDDKTMANFNQEERAAKYSHMNWVSLCKHLKDKKECNTKELIFVTGNKGKAEHAARLLGVPVTNFKIDLPEIQSLDLQEVVAEKLKTAYSIIKKPCFIEDVSLEFSELKRLPGTFIKFFESELGLEKLCRMLDGKDRSATARCIIGFTDGTKTEFWGGKQTGTIAKSPKGENGFGWDKIFIASGFNNKTNAELSEQEYDKYFSTMRRYDLLKENLQRPLHNSPTAKSQCNIGT